MITKLSLLIFVFFITITTSLNALHVNLDQPSITLTAEKGKVYREKIVISNKDNDALDVLVYLNDWAYKKNGAKKFMPAGVSGYSLKPVASIFPKRFTLGAKESKDVFLTLSPEFIKSRYGVVFFEVSKKGPPSKKSNVKLAGRIGSIIYYEQAETDGDQFTVDDIKLSLLKNKYWLKYQLNNTSSHHLKLKNHLLLLNDQGETIYRGEHLTNLLPQSGLHKVVFEKGLNLKKGNYKVLLVLGSNTDSDIVWEKNYTIE
jgi:hypothetical protein